MPVNSTSTGATYGKSSDPLCPLGFHPQVRWPTRCKRCFRDYKEHNDANDKKRYADCDRDDPDSWLARRSGFQKSKSLDVTMESSRRMVMLSKPSSVEEPNGKSIDPSEPASNQEPPKDSPMARSRSVQPEAMPVDLGEVRRRPASSDAHGTDPYQTRYSSTPRGCDHENEIGKLKSKNEELAQENQRLIMANDEATGRKDMSFEAAKANETAMELRKAKDKLRELEITLSDVTTEKKGLNLKLKELEAIASRASTASERQKNHMELETKLKYLENKCKNLERDNDKLASSVQTLEGELEEVQDNFREDEADEYRNLRRELELTSKNCRVLQFKLKKAEKGLQDVTLEKEDIQLSLQEGGSSAVGSNSTLDHMSKIKRLEKELEQKCQIIARYDSHVCDPKGNRKISPSLTHSSSVDRGIEDQLLKDLQDAIERENDLKEQLNIAEEENSDMRLKMSRFEDENESLLEQLKKMSGKPKRRSPSPAAAGKFGPTLNNSVEDTSEVKLQLELSEREAEVLRKKVEGLLSENMKLTKDLRGVKSELTKSSNGAGSLTFSNSNQLQAELTETRVKLVQKERQCDILENQLKYGSAKSIKKTNEEGVQKRLEGVEKEAEVLRQRNMHLEGENERLAKGSTTTVELQRKLSTLESQRKLAEKKAEELELKNSSLQQEVAEKSSLSKERTHATTELSKVKAKLTAETKRNELLAREKESETIKVDKVQRDLVAFQKEKRFLEEEKSRFQSMVTLLESDMKGLKSEHSTLQLEHSSLKGKNSSNLHQTQEGMKAFKEQIEVLKKEVMEEKAKAKEAKKHLDEANKRPGKDELDKLNERIKDLEEKWAKSKRINQQRKDKIDALERQVEESKKCLPGDVRALRDKLHEADKNIADLQKKVSAQNASPDDDLVQKFELMEEAYVIEKANLQAAFDVEQAALSQLTGDHATLQQELSTLRHTYNVKADDWIKEKLDIQRRIRDLEESIRNSAGGGWDLERERFKQIIEDRDSQITQLKIEGDVARSQSFSLRKECDDLKVKLLDYEKMTKFQKAVSSDSTVVSGLKAQLDDLKRDLAKEQKDKKSEVNMLRMKFDSKIALLSEEISVLKSQSSKYRRERQTYKEMMEGLQKSKTASKAETENLDKERVAEMLYKIHVLEDELSDAKLETSRAKAETMALQSKHEVELAELKSKINELEESALIESGRARIAGTRTKMELAWQKERDSQKKLINELSTMSKDLKATLFEVEKERDRERLEAKRKLEAMKTLFEDEQEDTRKQLTELQYDLLELRDAHAKLRTTNDKLKRDKDRLEKERDDFKSMVKEKSRAEQGEDKKVKRLIESLKEFLESLKRSGQLSSGSVSQLAAKLRSSVEELEQIHKMNEEEREQASSRRNGAARRGGSADGEGSESPSSRSSLRPPAQRRQMYRKTLSVSDTISENDSMWKSQDSTGSRESLASNHSIPLPVPVRTRSTAHGSESGYSSDYNNIRRIERDTSVDRLSTGSRESNRSTQSEWVGREKRKKSGLIGKLKKLTRGLSSEREREFGSGSDVSTASNVSRTQASGMVASPRSNSAQRSATLPRNPGSSNEPFDQYFKKASSSGVGPQRPTPPTPQSHSRVSSATSYRR